MGILGLVGMKVGGNRTLAVAVGVMALLLVLVFTGRLDPVRAALTTGICWVVVTHSAESAAHKRQILDALESAAKAGIEFRSGQTALAIETAELGVERICVDIKSSGPQLPDGEES